TKTQNCNSFSKAKFTLDDSPSPVDLKTSSNIIKGLEISTKPQVKYFQPDGYIIKINLSRDKLRRET
ncbi:hypothetical protein, partial [Citrobacter sp. wls757]|uniref:hypothetical protein n=1 Tax=Citrobacter sp. wls757 TaxID=2576417 RepID=UPI001BAF3C7E